MVSSFSLLFEKFRKDEDISPILLPYADFLEALSIMTGKKIQSHKKEDISEFADIEVFQDPDKKTIKIDTIRDLLARASQTPFGSWQVFCIVGLDDITSEAANRLLKVFEDRPKNTLFIATAHNPARVLPTLLSRMTVVGNFSNLASLSEKTRKMVDDFLTGRTLELVQILCKKDTVTREEAVDIITYALQNIARFPHTKRQISALETALVRLSSSQASVRPLLDLAFLPFLSSYESS